MNGEVKLCENSKKNWGGGGGRGLVGLGGGQGECEQRSEAFVKSRGLGGGGVGLVGSGWM